MYEVSKSARLEVERAAHPIAALIPGKITSTSLQLGRHVEVGEVLVELDASSERLRLREEEARLGALPPQIAALKREIAAQEQAREQDQQAGRTTIDETRARQRGALTAAKFAKENARRLSTLRASGQFPEIEVLRARAEEQKALAAVDALSLDIRRLDLDAQTRVHQKQADIEGLKRQAAMIEGQIESTTATIARLKQDIDKHLIRAPVKGEIGDVAALDVGAFVGEGGILGSVVPTGALKIVAEFLPAAVLGRIHPGQLGRLRLDGFPWAQYGSISARVDRVAREIRDNLVRVEFVPEENALSSVLLQHGLPGSVEVEIERVSPALLVLRAAGQMLAKPALQQSQSNAAAL